MKLTLLRKKFKKSQQEMADFLNITQASYSRYENNQSEPDIKTLIKLANFFNVSLDYLCENELSENKNENIKLFSDVKNNCYNLLVAMDEEQAKLTYSYMLGVTKQNLDK